MEHGTEFDRPNTNISKDTVSTNVPENYNLNILFRRVTEAAMDNTRKNSSDDFAGVAWHELQDHWQSVIDSMGGIGEGMILKVDEDDDNN